MDKYLQYNHLELAEDPSFIRWAKGSKPLDSQDWEAWLADYPEKADAVAKAKEMVMAIKFVDDIPSKELENKIWSEISVDIHNRPSIEMKPKSNRLIKMLPYMTAAAVALILILMNIGSDFDTTFETPLAMVENITLPDGSEVIVNADSKIQFDKKSWDKNRIVSLEGEAFFSVEKGARFTVNTPKGKVQVLGTSFNVYDRKGQLDVHCETGKVSVTSAGKETILTPHQSVTVINQEHKFYENVSDSDRRSTWKSGIFVYRRVLLKDVIEELERQFDIEIIMDKTLGEIIYTGSFDKSNMDNALTEVFYPLEIKFAINGRKITITK
jgi:ferric-dicitrate binding protein FerR (iron transport regulator)